MLCVILSVVLRFSRCLHPGVCKKRKENSINIVLCSFDVSTWTKSEISGNTCYPEEVEEEATKIILC
jgi:hypothetical protein